MEPGDLVTYTYNFINHSDLVLTSVLLDDDVQGVLSRVVARVNEITRASGRLRS